MCEKNSSQKSYTTNVTPSVLRDSFRKAIFFFSLYFPFSLVVNVYIMYIFTKCSYLLYDRNKCKTYVTYIT